MRMDNGQNGWPNRFLRIVSFVEDAILIVLLTAMIGFAVAQILLRNVFESGIVWADPLLRALVLWIGLAGAVVATRLDKHISINVLYRYLAPRMKLLARMFMDFFTAACAALWRTTPRAWWCSNTAPEQLRSSPCRHGWWN